MSKQVQLRRDSTANIAAFTGAVGEVIVDTTENTLVVQDGSTAGGFYLAKESDLTAHIGDTSAAHAASAISYAGGTGMSSTDVEAAIDELATEKLNATSYTAADVLAKLITVDGSGSGLDADLLDGHNTDYFVLAGGSTMTGLLVLSADPAVALGAATKQYVDSVSAGLNVKPAALCATTANITLLGEQTLDGITTLLSRVLVKNQTLAKENGIYLSGAGAWTRVTDMDAWAEVPGAFVFVERGTLYADTAFVCTADPGGTLDVTSITWSQFAGVGTYTAGTGLTLTGTQFSITNQLSAGGPTGSATVAPIITYNAQGQLTVVSSATITPAEASVTFTDITTGDVTSTKHGYAPKAPADATKFLNGAATPAYAAVKDSDLATTDITTNDASTSKHGFMKKLPNDATKFYDGTGAFSTPSGGSSWTQIANAVAVGTGTTFDLSGTVDLSAYEEIIITFAGISHNNGSNRALQAQVSTTVGAADTTSGNYLLTDQAGSAGAGFVINTTASNNSQLFAGFIKITANKGSGYKDIVSYSTPSGAVERGLYIGSISAIANLRLLWSGTGNFDAGTVSAWGRS